MITQQERRRTLAANLWAKRVDVFRVPGGLLVRGEEPLPPLRVREALFPVEDFDSDLLSGYDRAVRLLRNRTKTQPHVVLANAVDDAKLLAFVKRFGPVYVPVRRQHVRRQHSRAVGRALPVRWAMQDWATLRAEQQVCAGAVRLLFALGPDPLDRDALLIAVEQISAGVRGDRVLSGYARILGGYSLDGKRLIETFEEDYVRRSGFGVMVRLLNMFPLHLFVSGGSRRGRFDVDHLPESDESGIRPILYFKIHEDFVALGRGFPRIGQCGNLSGKTPCGEFFTVTRHGEKRPQRYCSARCSRLARHRERYYTVDREARRTRLARRRPSRSHPWKTSLAYSMQKKRLQSRKARSKRREL